ncbi:hypothetical protein [Desulforamulus reducens]|nr:hypothetical protein [Desulforamulus reducens]
MMLLSLASVYEIARILGNTPLYFALVAALFVPGILLFHYFFIWFPKALAKSRSLTYIVKIIYTALEESVLDQDSRLQVLRRINELLESMGLLLDLEYRRSEKGLLHGLRDRSLDKVWHSFFIQAFHLIEQEIKDETIRNWTFNKIKNHLNKDQRALCAKDVLRSFIGNSKYAFLVKDY